jgi:endogenous inhibitor of DNA gyrase (YacG/DUF329 family)
MIIPCPDCSKPMLWELDRIGPQPVLSSKCMACDPGGPWLQEPVEVLRKPRGRRPDQLPQPPD